MIEVRNFQFLFYGFSAAWLLVMLYIIYLVRREKKIQAELTRLKNMIGENK
jgi:CcmD family protein